MRYTFLMNIRTALVAVLLVLIPSAAFAATFTRSLDQGMSGADVTALQQILNQQGYLSSEPTGFFGALTLAAVSKFQAAHGLEALGHVGPQTKSLLNNLGASPVVTPTTNACGVTLTRVLALGISGDDVTKLQQTLVALKFLNTEPSGYFGNLTAAAVKTFQSSLGFEPVGSTGPKTRAALAAITCITPTSPTHPPQTATSTPGGGGGGGAGTPAVISNYVPPVSSGGGGGGGGGGSSSGGGTTPTAPVVPAPTLMLTASAPSVTQGGNASITWSTTNADSCAANDAWTGTQSTSGSQQFTNLAATSTFSLSCSGAGGSINQSVVVAVVPPPVPADVTAPVISNTAPSGTLAAGTTNASLSVTTNENASCRYANTSIAYASMNAFPTTGGTSHTAAISGLTNTTIYTYFVACRDTAGNTSANTAITFGVATPATPAPTVTISTNPISVTFGGSTILTWASTNASSCSASGGWTGTKATSGTQTFSNLSVNQTYTLQCSGTGGSATQSASVAVTGSAPDTTAPTAPSGLSGSAISQTQISLTWTASTDAVGVTGYRVLRGATQVGTPSGTSYSDSGLTAATQYTYTVKAIDAAGNLSNASNAVNVTTQAVTPPADTTPPSVTITAPSTNLAAGTTQTTLSVTTSEAATCRYSTNSSAAYSAMSAFTTTGNTSHTTTLSPLANSTSYTYYVKCQDAALNTSGNASVTFSVSTPPDTTAPSVPTGVNAAAVSSSQINITWTVSTDAVGVTGYQVLRNGAQVGTPNTNTYSDTGLTASTNYSYTVKAVDAAGNVSAASTAASATTQAGSGGGSVTGLLDTYPNATAAYSLRKLRNAYSGSAVQLRRSSDSTTQNIGFDASGNFDTTAAASFCGASTCYVATWYDQSGNTNNLTQTTASKQFQYIANGSLNGKPVLRGTTVTGMKAADSATYKTASVHAFTVNKFGLTPAPTGPIKLAVGYMRTATGNANAAAWGLLNGAYADTLIPVLNGDTNTNYEGVGGVYRGTLTQYEYSTADRTLKFNNTTLLSGGGANVTYPNATGLYVGMDGAGNSDDGDFAEIVLYGSTQASRAAIASNQISYWGITPPPTTVTLSDGSVWNPIYMGGYATTYNVNGYQYYPEAALNSYSLLRGTNAASGKEITRFEVHDGDDWDGTERSEYDSADPALMPLNSTFQISYSVKVEPGAQVLKPPSDWNILGQAHGEGGSIASPFYFMLLGDQFAVSVDDVYKYTSPTITRGQWYNFFVEYKKSSSGTADVLKVYINGTLVVNLSGKVFGTATGRLYWKYGIYRGYMSAGMPNEAVQYTNMEVVNKATTDISGRIAAPLAVPGASAPTSDTTAPTTPANLSAAAVSASGINLSWSASSDTVGVTGYKVFRNGTQITTVSTNSFSDSGLSASTQYSYTVAAYDAAGNTSAQSSSASATTQAPSSDTTAPSAPASLTATAASATQINLTWSASTDNVAVTGYRVFRGAAQVGTPTGTTYSDTGLTAATAYSYTVKATDAAGNLSVSSNTANATTQAAQQSDTTAPTITITAPTGQLTSGTTQTPLTVTTNENATCAWSTFSNTAFASMTAFPTTGGTSHSATLTNLSDGSSYITYVKCKDVAGNISADSQTSYSVPFAQTGGGGGGGGGGTASCTAADNFLARVSVDATHQSAYQTLICGLVTDGVFSKLDILYMLATQSATAALTNLVNGTYHASAIGAPSFTVNQGYGSSDAANYISFGWAGSNGPNYAQTSASYGGWSRDASSQCGAFLGTTDSTTGRMYIRFGCGSAGNGINAVINQEPWDDLAGNTTLADASGFWAIDRSGSTSQIYHNGSAYAAANTVTVSDAPTANQFRTNSDSNASTQGIATFFGGAHLSASEQSALYSRIHVFMQTIAGQP